MGVATENKNEKPKMYRTKPAPVCPDCGVLMQVGRTAEHVRYFYCPVPLCRCSAKQHRNDKLI